MRSRITALEYVRPSEVDDHPLNYRRHPTEQREILAQVLERIGIADALVAYRSEQTGRLTLIDGHLRRELLSDEAKVPILVLDLNDAEARALLALADPLVGMAEEVEEAYQALVAEVQGDGELAELFRHMDDMARQVRDEAEKAKPVFDIVPTFDERYDALLVFCRTEREWAELATALALPEKDDGKGRIGVTHVLTEQEFMQRWKSR